MNNRLNLGGVTTTVWTRTILVIIVAINVVLKYLGIDLIPVTEGEVGMLVEGGVAAFSAVIMLWAFWKNNDFTHNAQKVAEYKKNILIGAEYPVEPEEIDPDAMGFVGTEGLPETVDVEEL